MGSHNQRMIIPYSTKVVLLVYVDDIILAGADLDAISHVKAMLHSLFKLKDLGTLKYFIGLEIASAKGICLSQRKYTLSLFDDTGFFGFQTNCDSYGL